MTAIEALRSLGPEPLVVYDGDCPFCSQYVKWTRLNESIGRVTLFNAREIDPSRLATIQAEFNLNVGMLFVYGGRVYWGADAIHALALLTQPSGLFNRVNAFLFRRQALARLAYPALRAGRNLALLARGKSQIRSGPPAQSG